MDHGISTQDVVRCAMETTIYPKYQDIAKKIQERISEIESEYNDLSECVTKHGEDWHRAIGSVVQEIKSEIDNMKTIHLEVMMKQLHEINILTVDTKVHGEDFAKISAKIDASVPVFSPFEIENKSISKLFGSLSKLSIETEKHDYSTIHTERTGKSLNDESFPQEIQKSLKAESSSQNKQISGKAGFFPSVKQLLDEPETVSIIETSPLNPSNVACLNNDEIWTKLNDNIMRLFSINQGSLLKSIITKSGNRPEDIAVTKSGDLVYTDYNDRTVNIVKNKREEVISLQNWRPQGVCSTSCGDLLVIMHSDDYKPTKVVCYSGSTEKQTIQLDDQDKPFYSFSHSYRNIAENRNLDICVSDSGAEAVVVVNRAGKLRFRYTGDTPTLRNETFKPRGITTDSQSHILTADCNNGCVHIINQDGQFLRYIDSGLGVTNEFCIDTNDNLFVAQYGYRQMKKIKYLQ